ncbi:hypothetical protein [Nonomuraea endophytica]|uniref:Uncharacterized protein n=1 Tax=Nonomuraea endophytica TaxID=714136 RepID=A0A7W8A0T3_9ACTN|nr:hypothetical protein [Nonomuraea endophytica]MBB5076745.1 hypothetical protein [Nonomuraea endophytica]
MTTQRIAAQPAALISLGAHLGGAAAALPLSAPSFSAGGRPATGDTAADAALHDVTASLAAHLGEIEEIVRLTSRQAELTALAFRVAGG